MLKKVIFELSSLREYIVRQQQEDVSLFTRIGKMDGL